MAIFSKCAVDDVEREIHRFRDVDFWRGDIDLHEMCASCAESFCHGGS